MIETMVPLLNPSLKNKYSFEWKDDNNNVNVLSIDPGEIIYFTPPQAVFMMKHLTDAIMAEKGYNGINNVAEMNEIQKQIKVTL